WEHPPLAVGNYTASGNSLLAVGMPCAFYSQQKHELRKSNGNSVDTKFAKSWRNRFYNHSKTNQLLDNRMCLNLKDLKRFSFKVDVEKDLSKPVSQHYLPKGKEFAFAKPNHMIASSSFRNSSKNMPRFSLNDMVHNHYLDEAWKKTQERDKNSKPSVMPSARSQKHY
nr:hypothetical protein [Tanacetum cinerariifolium]